MPYCYLERQTRAAAETVKRKIHHEGYYYPGRSSLLEILKPFGVELLGKGTEVFVLAQKSPDGEDLAVALDYHETRPTQAKVVFYTHRLLSTLFPHNFPRFLAARGKLGDEEIISALSGTLRECKRPERNFYSFRILDERARFPFGEALKVMAFLHLPFEFPDIFTENFIFSPSDEAVYYLDTIRLTQGIFDTGEIITYMAKHGYGFQARHTVKQCIQRLELLRENSTSQEVRSIKGQVDHVDLTKYINQG